MICTLSSCTARAAQLARSMRARGGIVAATAARSMSGLITGHPQCNIPPAVAEKVGWNLHLRPAHPLGIIKGEIEARLQKDAAARGERAYKVFDQLSPVVTTQQNFDSLLIPADHVSRSPSDTYYLDAARVLRCHTSAHQVDLLRAGHDAFLATGDVYRRDDVDASHYFAFHQMEGVRVFEASIRPPARAAPCSRAAPQPRADAKAHAEQHLKASLEGVVDTLFGPVQKRWVPAYFPFTEPSFELEIHFQVRIQAARRMQCCGRRAAAAQPPRLTPPPRAGRLAGGAGLRCHPRWRASQRWHHGPQRLGVWAGAGAAGHGALLHTRHPPLLVLGQPLPRSVQAGADQHICALQVRQPARRQPPRQRWLTPCRSKYPPCTKDMTFWLPPSFHANDLSELARTVAGDLVERVQEVRDPTWRTALDGGADGVDGMMARRLTGLCIPRPAGRAGATA